MTNKVKLLTAFFVLSFAMMIGVLPFSIGGAGVLEAAAEETTKTYEEFTVTGEDLSNVYLDNNVLIINGSGPYTIAINDAVTTNNTATNNTIKVTSTNGATITLDNVYISTEYTVPFEITGDVNGKVTIILKERNSLATLNANAALLISTDKEVTIKSFDDTTTYLSGNSLYLYTEDMNESDPFISMGSITNDVNITIESGYISPSTYNAYSDKAVNIGSISGNADITIDGGYVNLEFSRGNKSIGIGSVDGDADITINDGTIMTDAANCKQFVAIGTVTGKATVKITGGNIEIQDYIVSTGDEEIEEIVGIGSDEGDADITIEGGTITIYESYGNKMTAIGTAAPAAEADTSNTESDDTETTSTGKATVTITGGIITITSEGATETTGIGSNDGDADVTISGDETKITITSHGAKFLDSTDDSYITGIGSDTGKADVEISGGDITINNFYTKYIAGIGSDTGKADVEISGGDITININTNTGFNYNTTTLEATGIGSDDNDADVTISGSAKIDITIHDSVEITGIGSDEGKADVTISGGNITIIASNSDDYYNHYYNTEIAGIGSDDGEAEINISDGTISIDVTNGIDATGIGSDTNTAAVNISGGNITVNLHTTSEDEIAVGIGTDKGKASIYISGGTITVTVDGTAVYDYAVYTGDDSTSDDTYSVYILPAYGRALDVKYNADSEDTSLYVLKTDIAYKADGTSFYCSVSDGGQVVYEDKNLSVQSTTSEEVDVYVSVYGDQGERFLDEVMLVTEEAYHIVDIDQLLYYEEATLNDDDTEAVVFHAEITDGDGFDKTYYALVRTFYNLDATNSKGDIIYYLSNPLKIAA